MSQNSNFRLPRGHLLRPKLNLTVMAPNHGGDPLGSILGPMGSHWGQKWVKTVKNCHASKFEFLTTAIDFGQNLTLRLWRQIRCGPPRVHLGANGVPLGPKNGSEPLKIGRYGYGAKSRWGPPRAFLFGPMRSHWGQNLGKTAKNYHAPKFEFSTKIWALRLWRQITVGTSRDHLGSNGVPLGPKNGSKP